MLENVTNVSDSLRRWQPGPMMAAAMVIMAIGSVAMMGYTGWSVAGAVKEHDVEARGAQSRIEAAVWLNALTSDYQTCMYFADTAESKSGCRIRYETARNAWTQKTLK